jgi:hypothetical protein
MAYTALQLITKAFWLSGVVARNLEVVTGDKASEGLALLNEVLALGAAETRLVPYFQTLDLILLAGQEEYILDDVIEVESLTFNIDNVRYPTTQMGRQKYFASGRVNNLQSLPISWHAERQLDGMKLYVYFLPNQTYTAQAVVKKGLTSVPSLQTDLSLVYDNFYLSYLRYALAEYMCEDYDIQFAPQKVKRLAALRDAMAWVSPPDLTMRKISLFNERGGTNWAFLNLSQGYLPL